MYYHTALMFITIMTMLMMILHINKSFVLKNHTRKGFTTSICIVIITTLCEFFSLRMGGILPNVFLGLLTAIQYSITPLLAMTWVRSISSISYLRYLIPFFIINAIINFSSIFTEIIFYYDDVGTFCRGEYYWIYVLVYTISIIILFGETYRFSTKFQSRNTQVLLMMSFFLVICIFANLVLPNVHIRWISVAITCAMFYIYYTDIMLQTDSLTSLLNRTSYEKKVLEINYTTTIILFDVDDFKKVNDTYGHVHGDAVLKTISNSIREIYGRYALCYRIGGDEFAAILKENVHGSSEQYFDAFVEHLNRKFEDLIKLHQSKDTSIPDVSVGFKVFDGNTDIKEIINNADYMMYELKNLRKQQKKNVFRK